MNLIFTCPSEQAETAGVIQLTAQSETLEEEMLVQELMRVQGILTALTTTLQEAVFAVQIDLVETISKLLFKNQINQNEFKKIDGYSFFLRLLERLTDFSTEETKLFLEVSTSTQTSLSIFIFVTELLSHLLYNYLGW
jgi:hypothetical protein